jgi:tripartite-type tricarboxylate transporter receptor subunit TctC
VSSWHALIAPRGLPQTVLERVHREISTTLRARDVGDRMQSDGVSPAGSTPEALRAHLHKEIAMWKGVVSRAHIKLE